MMSFMVNDSGVEHKILISVLIIGIIGNLAVLLKLIIDSSKKSFKMLLKYLIINNLIGLSGITTLSILHHSISPETKRLYSDWLCVLWVVFRFFGIFSGCIAVVMSIERYLAVCYVFFHHIHVTSKLKKKVLILVSFVVAIITFSPFIGFGLYVDRDTKECLRYEEARTPVDRAYAIFMLIFGTLICIIIVTFNTLVIRALFINMRRSKEIFQNSTSNLLNPKIQNTLPPVEIKFSKLMLWLDLSFVICWMPEMIGIIFALTNTLPKLHWFYKIADALMALHFTLDPYIYMLTGLCTVMIWKLIFSKRRVPSSNNTSSTETSSKTSNEI